MKASVAVTKVAETQKDSLPARSDNSSHRAQNEPEMQLGSLRGVINVIRLDGGTPSVDSIAIQLSGMTSTGRASVLQALQQTHGNLYVQQVVLGVQAKLMVGQPNDRYEQEADRVADTVMKTSEPQVQRQLEEEEEKKEDEELVQTKTIAEQNTPLVQRQVEEEEEEEEEEELNQPKPFAEQITPLVQRQPEGEVVQSKSEKSVTSSYPGRYVHRVAAWIQAKLKPGPPNDRYEQEADRVADTVMRAHEPQVQRQLEEEEEEEELIQSKPLAEQITTLVQRQTEGVVMQSKSEKSVSSSYPGRYVHRVAAWIQAKLKPGPPNDRYEQEADRVADAVMRMPEPAVQRQVEGEEEEEKLLQAKQYNALVQRQPLEEEELLQTSFFEAPPVAQTKLIVCAQDDEYEREADRVAETVMHMPATPDTSVEEEELSGNATLGVQRMVEPTPEEESIIQSKRLSAFGIQRVYAQCTKELKTSHGEGLAIQTKEEGASEPRISPYFQRTIQLSNGGLPLPDTVRSRIEPVLGADLGNVRVHSDANSNDAAKSLQAKAFTHGTHIWLGPDQSADDIGLMAHEATHVVQQGVGPSTQVIQRADNGNGGGTLERVTTFGARIRQGISGAVERGREFVGGVAERIAEVPGATASFILAQLPEGLVSFIRRGPLEVIRERIGSTLASVFTSLSGRVDLGDVFGRAQDWFSRTFSMIQRAATGGEGSCAAFAAHMNNLYELARDFIQNPIFEALRSGVSRANELIAETVRFFVQPAVDSIPQIWSGLQNLGATLRVWLSRARTLAGPVWTWVARRLGLSTDDSGDILTWFRNKANQVWTGFLRSAPMVYRNFMELGRRFYRFSPLHLLHEVVESGRSFMTMARWIWAHRNDPNMVAKATQDPAVRDTILPRFLEVAQDFGGTMERGFRWLNGQLTSIVASILNLLGDLSGVPILNIAVRFVGRLRSAVKHFRVWATTSLPQFLAKARKTIARTWERVRPITSIVTLLGIGALNPPLLPGIILYILTLGAWLLVPDCYKEPIIDFVLRIITESLRAIPDFPTFGPLWHVLKPGIIAFLERIRERDPNKKIEVIDRIARILLFSGPEFVIGFVVGVLQGIWEALTDPFKLLFQLAVAPFRFSVWVSDIADRLFGRRRRMPSQRPVAGTGEPSRSSAGLPGGGTMRQRGSTQAASGTEPDQGLEQIGVRLSRLGQDLREPAETIRDNLYSALREYFSGSEGSTFKTLRERLGQLWERGQDYIQEQSRQLADRTIDALLAPGAERVGARGIFRVGKFIGWLGGTIVAEVVIAYLSAGTVTFAKGIMKVIQTIARVVDRASDIIFGPIFRLLRQLGRRLMSLADSIVPGAVQAGSSAIRPVVDALSRIGTRILNFGDEVAVALGGRITREVGEEMAESMASRAAGEALETTTRETTEQGARETVEALAGRGGAEAAAERGATEFAEESTEELATEAAVLRNRVRSPEYVGPVTNPRYAGEYDVEIPVGRHTYRRHRESRHWCRFSDPICSIELDDVNTAVDSALPKVEELQPEVAVEAPTSGSPEAITTDASTPISGQSTGADLVPGSPAHQATRWAEYQQRGGTWSYERWSNVYEHNMVRARMANEAVDAYRGQIGWGGREVTVNVEGTTRRLDIADLSNRRGVEVKTGNQYLTQDNTWEILRDRVLVEEGWDIEWHFDGHASEPLLRELNDAGIQVTGI